MSAARGTAASRNGVARAAWLLLSLALVGAIGLLDIITGSEVSVALLYLAPVALLAWRGEPLAAVALPLLAAATWATADRLAGHEYSHPMMGWWNTAIRFGFFLTTGLLVLRLRTAVDQIALLARTDGLTGALNASAFRLEVDEAIEGLRRGGTTFSLAYLDLDDFKRVNDELGHEAGDEVLRQVAVACAATLRTGEALGRLGGDEFAMLMPGADRAAAETTIRRVAAALRDATTATGSPVTASTGVVSFEEAPQGSVQALQAVDSLMFQAKRAGKARIAVGLAPAPSRRLDDGS